MAGQSEVSSPPAGSAIQSPWQAPEFSGSMCSLSSKYGNDLVGGRHALILDAAGRSAREVSEQRCGRAAGLETGVEQRSTSQTTTV